MNPELNAVASDYWDFTLESSPTFATLIGDHRFDDQIEDFSVEAESLQRLKLERFAERLDGLDHATLDLQDEVTAKIMAIEVANSIRMIDLGITELRSDQMDGPHVGALMAAPQLAAETPEQADALLGRFSKLAGSLDQAAQRFRGAVARGRPPAALCIDRAIHSIDGYLASSLDDDLFVNLRGPTGWDGESLWRERLRKVVADSVRPGYQRMRDVLAQELAPVARPDDRAGLCWIEGGEEIYAALLETHTSLPVTPDELHEFGIDEAERQLPAAYRQIGDRVFATTDLATIFQRLRTDPELRFRSEDEIMDLARTSLDRATDAMASWFGRLPQASCRIEPVPAVLADDAPAAYYFPPAADGSRPGTYFVNLRNPTEQSRFEAESIAFHEAIPGHHLQLAIASELTDLPAFRRMGFGNTAYIEGWGLYAERLAEDMGLYSDDIARLGMLAADSWRSGRLVVDTGLHAKGWSRQQAVDYFLANSPVAAGEIEVEVDRYVAIPGQAVAYKVGQREILGLRERARAALGDRFDIAAFHDVVLGSGGVVLPVLADLVDRWIADTAE
ncbi:MAG: DUF885 domain-containing protein [Acidimicrobiales bacterium]